MSFRTYILNEAEMLDISIQSANKYLTSEKKILDFLTTPCIIEHKTDGIKCTVVKVKDTGKNDWVVAYKGDVLHKGEFDYLSNSKIKSSSINTSQFKLVLDHFENLGKTEIPINTELFIEFLMKKPTLSSNYNVNHRMVLIGYSKCTWSVNFGKLKTKPVSFEKEKRKLYAKILGIDVPQLLFQGVLGAPLSFENGIKNDELKSFYNQRKAQLHWDNPKLLINELQDMFLIVESKYGGKEEGVVIEFSDRLLKWQQTYQLDQEARALIKMKYQDEPHEMVDYWDAVKNSATSIVQTIVIRNRKIEDLIQELATEIKNFKLTFSHPKRSETIVKDDIQTTAKIMLIKKLKGNNNALVLGKFRVLSNAHYDIIKRGLKLYDDVVIAQVTGADTKDTKDLRYKMLKAAFPNLEIVQTSSGNLIRIITSASKNVNAVLAGSDRVQSYKEQLRTMPGVAVKETKRSDDDISATKIITNIEDEAYFKANTPKEIHSMYKEILKTYKV